MVKMINVTKTLRAIVDDFADQIEEEIKNNRIKIWLDNEEFKPMYTIDEEGNIHNIKLRLLDNPKEAIQIVLDLDNNVIKGEYDGSVDSCKINMENAKIIEKELIKRLNVNLYWKFNAEKAKLEKVDD